MGPKVRFTREQVVDAAFEIAKTEGIDKVTMRKIAEKMGSSVAPIYVNFTDVNELTEALIEKVVHISEEILIEESTENPFNDIGRASMRFAKEYSTLFKDLVIKNSHYMKGYDDKMVPMLIEEMKEDPELADLTEDELKSLLLKMKIFQLGLSIMVANDQLPGYGEQDLMELMGSVSSDIILGARQRAKSYCRI